MSDIFQEVDEAVHQDQAMRWWKRFSPFVYTGVAALVLGVAGYEFWQWQSSKKHQAEAEAFYVAKTALSENDYALAAALFEDIASSESSYAELSANMLAEVRLSAQGDKASAIAALKQGADGEGPFAQLARLKAGYLMADDVDIAELESWLAPLTNDQSSPYAFLAEEAIASRAFSLGDLDTARTKFNSISLALDVPSAVRMRAERALIAIDAINARNGSSS